MFRQSFAWHTLLWTLVLAGTALRPSLAATVVVGNHSLKPNQSGQVVTLDVSGGEIISGLDLYVQIGDGGPQLAEFGLPAGEPGPSITGVDLKTQTIFAPTLDLPYDLGSPALPQVSVHSLALIGSVTHVAAVGRFVTLEIDTSGFFGGSWPLKLRDVLPFSEFGGPLGTTFIGTSHTTIENGSIAISLAGCDTDGDGRCDPLGDLNGNRVLDVGDIDSLSLAIRRGRTDRMLDMNDDGRVNALDHEHWVRGLKRTWPGDANLDGLFDSSDFVQVFTVGYYEVPAANQAGWADGDWNADGLFSSGDLVAAFQAGGYNAGGRPALPSATIVPEPCWSLISGPLLWLLLYSRRPKRTR
jgi:hypothetical protein